jgi:hypothetical protein
MQAGYLLEGFNQNIVGLHWDVLPLNSLINVLILKRGGGKGAESHITAGHPQSHSVLTCSHRNSR